MKKAIYYLLFIWVMTFVAQAQVPQQLNYQGVLKNIDGSIRPDTEASLTIELIQNSTIVYSEVHHIHTNSQGYFSICPGKGEISIGQFDTIDWSITPTTMRSILDGITIAETTLSSVPYALLAHHFDGEKELVLCIDSLSEHLHNTAIQVDSNIVAIDNIYHYTDSIVSSIDSLQQTTNLFNATAEQPLPNGIYHTAVTARNAVPQHIRQEGFIVTYRCDTLNWVSQQFIANDTALWDNHGSWRQYGSHGNYTLPYYENDSLTRIQVPLEYRKQGMIISYYNRSHIVNEQYIATLYENEKWGHNTGWIKLLDNSHLLQLDKAIAHIDSVTSTIQSQIEELSNKEAWHFTQHNDLFSQAGGIDYTGKETLDLSVVHTPLIPINEQWVITTYYNDIYPAIAFFSDENYDSFITTTQSDSTTTSEWQLMQYDMSCNAIPSNARYFAINMSLAHQEQILLQQRTPLSQSITTPTQYKFQSISNNFAYIGSYVDCNGKRLNNANMRHTRFMAIEDSPYKISSIGYYSNDTITPIIVFYTDASYDTAVEYDLGQVNNDKTTTRELIVSRETAPSDANYFIVNWAYKRGECSIMKGNSIENIISNSEERISAIEENLSCYANRKLVTIGDSFTTNGGNSGKLLWQEWLMQWLGVTWSKEETITGTNNYMPMGVGGAWIIPNDINSISIRCKDVRRYNPDVIILYGGQNDMFNDCIWGTIDDEPFIPSQVIDLSQNTSISTLEEAIEYSKNMRRPKSILHVNQKLYYIENDSLWNDITAWVNPYTTISFYAAYKGIVQRLITENPKATLYCLTYMQCNEKQYNFSMGTWEEVTATLKRKCEIVKEVANLYGAQVIDLWNHSGVTPYNANSLYFDWLHPNQFGYRKLAECIYRTLK